MTQTMLAGRLVTLGHEVAGTVAELGDGVTTSRRGSPTGSAHSPQRVVVTSGRRAR
jgi:D-arabinose 1-dehydrogenase-like Zn-dependent alcohol dehydrogenase